MRPIDADELDESLARITPSPAAIARNPMTKAIPQVVDIFRKRIADAPTLDAVVVVRCEDCRYRPMCKLYAIHHERDNFCRKGVRIGERIGMAVPDSLQAESGV